MFKNRFNYEFIILCNHCQCFYWLCQLLGMNRSVEQPCYCDTRLCEKKKRNAKCKYSNNICVLIIHHKHYLFKLIVQSNKKILVKMYVRMFSNILHT